MRAFSIVGRNYLAHARVLGESLIDSGAIMTISNGATTAAVSFASDTVNTAQNIADAINGLKDDTDFEPDTGVVERAASF